MHKLRFPLRRFGTLLSHSPDTKESIATGLISTQDNGNRPNFVGATLDEIRERISAVVPGIKSFVGLQIYQFIYRKGSDKYLLKYSAVYMISLCDHVLAR